MKSDRENWENFERTFAEIGDELGISAKAAKGSYQRAIKKIIRNMRRSGLHDELLELLRDAEAGRR